MPPATDLKTLPRPFRLPLNSPPSSWPGRIILWGHDSRGPFSIIEGNHRMLAYAHAAPRQPLNLDVCIGLSPSYCYWHFADPGIFLGNDLFKKEGQIVSINNWPRLT